MPEELNYDITLAEFRPVLLTCLLTMFGCWALQEIMERGMGMAPNIVKQSDLDRRAKRKDNPIKHVRVNKMMSKSLDLRGRYRIQTRGTIYFIKALHQLIMFIVSLAVFTVDTQWFVDHFILLKAESTNYVPYQHVSASLVGYYAWEVIANRYGRLAWSVLIHHWVTAGTATLVLLGRYSPFATWYGFVGVFMCFPTGFLMGFRAQYSNKHPELTRKAFLYCAWYYAGLTALNLCGQLFMIVTALSTGRIELGFIILILCCMCAWVYDDIQLLRAYHEFSKHDYEDADILTHRSRSYSRSLGGRMLFAMSVLEEVKAEKVAEQQTLAGADGGGGNTQTTLRKAPLSDMDETAMSPTADREMTHTHTDMEETLKGRTPHPNGQQQTSARFPGFTFPLKIKNKWSHDSMQLQKQTAANQSLQTTHETNVGGAAAAASPITPYENATLTKMESIQENEKDTILELVQEDEDIRKSVFPVTPEVDGVAAAHEARRVKFADTTTQL